MISHGMGLHISCQLPHSSHYLATCTNTSIRKWYIYPPLQYLKVKDKITTRIRDRAEIDSGLCFMCGRSKIKRPDIWPSIPGTRGCRSSPRSSGYHRICCPARQSPAISRCCCQCFWNFSLCWSSAWRRLD